MLLPPLADPSITVGIVTCNSAADVLSCLCSIPPALGGRTANVIVVDNASSDGTLSQVRQASLSCVLVENTRNAGYAAALNQVVARSTSPFLILCNADVVFRPGSIDRLVSCLEKDRAVAWAGPLFVTPDGQPRSSARSFPTLLLELCELFLLHRLWPTNPVHSRFFRSDLGPGHPGQTDYVVGAALGLRRTAILEAGGFDEGYFLYFEETDFAWRLARAGRTVFFCPEAVVEHREGGSSKGDPLGLERAMWTSQYRFFRQTSGRTALAVLWLIQLAGCLFRSLWWGSRRLLHDSVDTGVDVGLARSLRHLRWLVTPWRR